jgi:pimeloyl-ACP methyl ester carboxylesterase
MYVRESGPADAPTIVFLHGGGIGGWMWGPVVERLSDYHCLVPDLPEHGRSLEEKPFTFERAAAAVADLIRTQAHNRFAAVVGLSLGAQTAAQLLATAPGLVERAIISGTLARPAPGASLLSGMMRLYGPFKNMSALIRANMRNYDVPDAFYEPFAEDTRLLTGEAFAHIISANLSFKPPAALSAAACPVLVLVGAKEPGMMKASARDLVNLIPGAAGRMVAGVGHNWLLAAPDLCSQVIRAWITGGPLPAELVSLDE